MQKDVWIDARSLSRPYVTGWERYVRNLESGLRNYPNITFETISNGSKLNLLASDLKYPTKSKNFKVAHFPTYPPIYKSRAKFQILTIHDLTWWKFSKYSSYLGKYYYKFFMEKAIKNSSAIIVPSNSIKKELQELFKFNEKSIFVIEHGNSLPQGIPKKIEKPYFLSFGTIEPRKNLDFYAEAIIKSGLTKDFDFIHVGRIGWGSLPKIFKHISANDQELANWIINSHCVVVPSLYEGFGLPVLETHFQGKNVLLSNDPALCELKLDSDFVFELNNIESLISQLKNISTRVNKLTNEELEKTKQQNWSKSIQKHLDLYRKFYE